MSGCFGLHPEDIAREHELNKYLNNLDDEIKEELELDDEEEYNKRLRLLDNARADGIFNDTEFIDKKKQLDKEYNI